MRFPLSLGRAGPTVSLLVLASATVVACDGGGAVPEGEGAPEATAPERTNVVVIVMDTTRADRCSVHGYERPTTPELERLAADGVAFDAAWAPSSWTLPTHGSLFTGLLPEEHGATMVGGGRLVPGHHTLAEHLRDAGYATGAFSNNPWVSEEFGMNQGFGTFVPLHKERNLPYPTAIPTHEQALAWVDRQTAADRPFFLMINDMEPHAPYAPPRADADRFVRTPVSDAELERTMAFDFPELTVRMLGAEPLTDAQLALLSDLYDAEIAALDREIGRLADALAERGLLDQTLFVVVGDHGEHFGENGLVEHSLSLGQRLLHVPLVIRHPVHFAGGRRVADVARVEDLFATVLEVCGIEPPEGIHGRSLVGETSGRTAVAYLGAPRGVLRAVERLDSSIDMSAYDVTLRSVFDGRFQLIRTSAEQPDRLFDTQADPRGEADVAGEHPDVLSRLGALLPE